MFRAAHRVSGTAIKDLAENEEVEEHPDRGQMLFDGWRRDLTPELFGEPAGMDGVDISQAIDSLPRAPVSEAPCVVEVGLTGGLVADVGGKLGEARGVLSFRVNSMTGTRLPAHPT